MKELEERVLSPLKGTDRGYLAWVTLLTVLGLAAIYSIYVYGAGPKGGVDDPALWGVYNSSTVFFVGIAMGGVLVSGLLRIGKDPWGGMVTRVAEASVVSAILVALFNVVCEAGDLPLVLDTVFYGQVANPLAWTGILVAIYLVVGCAILYFPLVPDMGSSSLWVRRWRFLYRILTFGYTGTDAQKADVKRIALVVGVIATIGVLVAHTALAWALEEVAAQPDWTAAMGGPLFITAGLLASFAMAAAVASIMSVRLGLDRLTAEGSLRQLSRWLLFLIIVHLVVSVVYIQSASVETADGTEGIAGDLWTGRYALLTWTLLLVGLVLPALMAAHPLGGQPRALLAASGLVLGTMWLRAYMVAVPGLSGHSVPFGDGVYMPSMEEWTLALGSLAWFALMLSIIYKMAPMISLWEVTWRKDVPSSSLRGWGQGTPFYRMMYYVWVPTFVVLLAGVASWIAISVVDEPALNPDLMGDFPSPLFIIVYSTIAILVVSFVAAFFQTRGWTAFVSAVMVIVGWLAIVLLDWIVGTWGSRMVLLGAAAVLGLVVGIVLFLLFIKRSQTGIWLVLALLVAYSVLTWVSLELDAPNLFLGVFLFNTMVLLTLVGYKLLITVYTYYKRYTMGA